MAVSACILTDMMFGFFNLFFMAWERRGCVWGGGGQTLNLRKPFLFWMASPLTGLTLGAGGLFGNKVHLLRKQHSLLAHSQP